MAVQESYFGVQTCNAREAVDCLTICFCLIVCVGCWDTCFVISQSVFTHGKPCLAEGLLLRIIL